MPFLPSVASSYGAAAAQSVPGITPVAGGAGLGAWAPPGLGPSAPTQEACPALRPPLKCGAPSTLLRFPTDQQPLSSLGALFCRLPRLCYLGLPTPTAFAKPQTPCGEKALASLISS